MNLGVINTSMGNDNELSFDVGNHYQFTPTINYREEDLTLTPSLLPPQLNQTTTPTSSGIPSDNIYR